MSEHSEEVRKKRLLKTQDWDTHNKHAEKAAQVFQDHIATEGQLPKKKKPRRKWLVVLIVLLILASIAATVYWFVLRDIGEPEVQQTASSSQQPTESETSLSSGATKKYDSSDFYLSFDYPDTWVVDDSDVDALTVTSPATSLQTASSSSVKGKVIMTIRHKGNPLTEFDKGNVTATKQSELLTYTKPTQAQRASTYLTFAAYAGMTTGLDALYITGDYGYQVGQAILKTEMAGIDPVIMVSFGQCTDAACTKTTPLFLSLEQWADPNFSGPIKAMLQSIAIS